MLRIITQIIAAPPVSQAIATLQLTGSPVSAAIALVVPALLRSVSGARCA